MNLTSIKTRTALTIVVAAALPQAAQATEYKPFQTDFGATPPAQVSRPSYKPFQTDFPSAQVTAVRPDDRSGIHGIGTAASTSSRPAASYYTPQALKALGARWQALANADSAASHYTPQALQAMGQRYEALAKAISAGGSTTDGYVVGGKLIAGNSYGTTVQGLPAYVKSSSSTTFDWTDAAVGAASGLGIALLLAGGLVLGLSIRREHNVAAL